MYRDEPPNRRNGWTGPRFVSACPGPKNTELQHMMVFVYTIDGYSTSSVFSKRLMENEGTYLSEACSWEASRDTNNVQVQDARDRV